MDGPHLDGDGNTVLGSSSLPVAAPADQFIVQVDDTHALADVADELADDGIATTNTMEGAVIGLAAPLDAAALRELRARDDVVTVEHDERIEASDIQQGAPWNLDRIDQRGWPPDGHYSHLHSGRGVTAYVIDSGIRETHLDFGGRVNRSAYWAFGDGTGINDCNGHGTHVAGILGGATWGVAEAVNIVPVKVLNCSGASSTSIVVEGINWVINDHRSGEPAVVNMSLGGPGSTILDDAVLRMIQDGVTVVVAAGNDSAPSCYYSPARVAEAITVGASAYGDGAAYFSNYGGCNDLYAPGDEIESASNRSDTGSAIYSGTSMAAPHVAGAAALILERSPSATPAQVWAAMNADTTTGTIPPQSDSPDKLLHVTPVLTRPSAPRSPKAAPASGAVRSSWAAPSSNGGAAITDYIVQRSANRSSWSTVRDGVSTSRSAAVGGLTNGRRYYFRVAAKNRVGAGPWSAIVSAIPAAKPSAPRSLTTVPANGAVRLSWAAPSSNGGAAITDYIVQRSANRSSWSTVRDGVSTSRSATVGGLTNGRRYYFRVAAKNRVGAGPWSAIVSTIPVD